MSMTALVVLAAFAAASPRSSAALKKQEEARSAPLGIAADLTLSITTRPEHSKGGSDLLSQAGLRGAYLWTMGGRDGLTVGGELALRALNPGAVLDLQLPFSEREGSDTVFSELYLVTAQVGGIVGYRLATQNLSLTPHASFGLNNGLGILHMRAPGSDSWRPRLLPGIYGGGGVIATFFMVMLRLDAALGFMDGRPDYRFDTGLGVYF